MEVRTLERNEEDLWGNYILALKSSNFFCQIGWRNVVQKTYRLKPFYLVAYDKAVVKGVLPLFIMKSVFFGKRLISIPFGPFGGIYTADKNAKESLLLKAKKLTEEKKLDYLELRFPYLPDIDLPQHKYFFTMEVELDENPDVVWKKLDKKVRNSTRKAIKSGLSVTIDRRYLEDFYHLYALNMWEVGTPVHKYAFFKNLLGEFPDKVQMATVHHENKIIASMILLSFKETVISGWAASDKRYLNMSPNNILYWETIKYCCENDYKYFDFGRSMEGSGTYNFKMKWATVPKQLFYIYYLNRISEIPKLDPSNPKYEKSIRKWKKMPFWVTKLFGPMIRKNLP
ncbi:MAG: FemAB family PEP-CTERM system-associated protein [Candidatus Heimdallarchaeota archaeon]|nr:MAG: FemAB family PEP-CTERM system-associated protein [Candidatus Heimdallarchaeota archaeon]